MQTVLNAERGGSRRISGLWVAGVAIALAIAAVLALAAADFFGTAQSSSSPSVTAAGGRPAGATQLDSHGNLSGGDGYVTASAGHGLLP